MKCIVRLGRMGLLVCMLLSGCMMGGNGVAQNPQLSPDGKTACWEYVDSIGSLSIFGFHQMGTEYLVWCNIEKPQRMRQARLFAYNSILKNRPPTNIVQKVFSPDCRRLAIINQNQCWTVDLENGSVREDAFTPNEFVVVAWADAKTLLLITHEPCGEDRAVCLWRLETGRAWRDRKLIFEGRVGVWDVKSFSPDGRYVAFTQPEGPENRKYLKLLDMRQDQLRNVIDAPLSDVSVSWKSDGSQLFFFGKPYGRDVKNGEQVVCAGILDMKTMKIKDVTSAYLEAVNLPFSKMIPLWNRRNEIGLVYGDEVRLFLNADTMKVRELPSRPESQKNHALLPDGRRMECVSKTEVKVHPAESGGCVNRRPSCKGVAESDAPKDDDSRTESQEQTQEQMAQKEKNGA